MISTEYVAGFFDGEGCVNISADRNNKPFIRILIVNTDNNVLEQFKKQWGGNITHNKRQKENWKRSYTWRLSHQKAINFLKDLEPHLIVKKKQTNLAISFYEVTPGKGSKWSDESLQKANEIIDQIRFANKKGVEA